MRAPARRLLLSCLAAAAGLAIACGGAGASTVGCGTSGTITIDDGTHTVTGTYNTGGCTGTVAIPEGVVAIDPYVLWNARITHVTIPSTVTSIGASAFGATDLLTGIDVAPGNPSFSSDATGTLFDKLKTALIQYPLGRPETTYVIPPTVRSLGENSFFMAANLTHMEIPTGVTSLGQATFRDTTRLASITFAEPSSLTTIALDAFYQARALTSIALPDSVTSLGRQAFVSATSLTSVKLPDNPAFVRIGARTFQGATSLARITIPRSVAVIDDYAFKDASGLLRIEFQGATAPDVGRSAFAGTAVGATAYRTADSIGWGSSPWHGLLLAYYLPTPGAPVAIAGDGTATVTATAATFGPAPDAYAVRAVEDASRTCTITAPATACTVAGLVNGRTYTFTATASTAAPALASEASAASNAVTPAGRPASAAAPGASTAPARPLRVAVTRTSSASITTAVTADASGVVTQIGITAAGRRDPRATGIRACSASKTVTRPGVVTLTCTLTNAAKRLRLTQALRITLTTTFTPTVGAPRRSTRVVTLARTGDGTPAGESSASPSAVTG